MNQELIINPWREYLLSYFLVDKYIEEKVLILYLLILKSIKENEISAEMLKIHKYKEH